MYIIKKKFFLSILFFKINILSIFKDKAIVLKIDKIWEKELMYTLFSHDFWKIRANKKFSKKEKNLDLWYIINFEIMTLENQKVHKIKNVKIKSEFNLWNNKSFSEINTYLEIISFIFKETIDWVPNQEIFSIFEEINKNHKIDETKLILAKLKIKAIIWNLNVNHKNPIIEKILKFLFFNKITEVFKLTWINDELKEELKKIL